MRTGLLHTEKTLAHLHRARTMAGRAGLGAGAGFGAAAVAGVAFFPAGDAQLGILAVGRFFERDLHRVAEVSPTEDLTATAATATAEDVAKDVAKGFAETAKTFRTAGAAHVRVDASVTILVIGRAFLAVGEHFVGFLDLLELGLGLLGGIPLVAVRVVFHRQLAISLLDVLVRSVLGHAQHFVKIAFRHVLQPFQQERREAASRGKLPSRRGLRSGLWANLRRITS